MRPVKLDVILSMHMETVLTIFAGAMVLYLMHRLLNFAVYACRKHEAKPPPGRFTDVIEDHVCDDDCVLDPWHSRKHGYPSTINSAQTRIRSD